MLVAYTEVCNQVAQLKFEYACGYKLGSNKLRIECIDGIVVHTMSADTNMTNMPNVASSDCNCQLIWQDEQLNN